MHPALWVSKSGLDAQQTDITVISNNLANVNTTGFKKSRAVFQDLLYQNIRQPGGENQAGNELPSGLTIGTGVKIVATRRDFSGGNVLRTDNSLDVAINGRGFFQILRADGTTGYTRDGQFSIDDTGILLNADGLQLQPTITVPANTIRISIGKEGAVEAFLQGQTAPTNIGTITLADFINPAGLEPIGDNLFLETASSGAPTTGNPNSTGLGTLEQGTLEASNVNVVEELVNLIQTQRAYEMNAKAVETVDSMLQFVAQVL